MEDIKKSRESIFIESINEDKKEVSSASTLPLSVVAADQIKAQSQYPVIHIVEGPYMVESSWSSKWGDSGFCYIPYEKLTEEYRTREE